MLAHLGARRCWRGAGRGHLCFRHPNQPHARGVIGRADELDARGFQATLNIVESLRPARRQSIVLFEALNCLASNAHGFSKGLCRPVKQSSGRSNLRSSDHFDTCILLFDILYILYDLNRFNSDALDSKHLSQIAKRDKPTLATR